MAQIFLNFMQFFAIFGKIICWRPPEGLAPPPTGNPGSTPGNTSLIRIAFTLYISLKMCFSFSF